MKLFGKIINKKKATDEPAFGSVSSDIRLTTSSKNSSTHQSDKDNTNSISSKGKNGLLKSEQTRGSDDHKSSK